MKQFEDYFEDDIEFCDNRAYDILRFNVLYYNMSNTLLDALINHVRIVKAFVLGINDWEEEIFTEISIMDPPYSKNWIVKQPENKLELFDLATKPGNLFHKHLDCDFLDDVLILAKAFKTDDENGEFCWIFLWYSREGHDCVIGRFITKDEDQLVIDSFTEYADEVDYNEFGKREIPLDYFIGGWLRSH